jgi:hypothetical protein
METPVLPTITGGSMMSSLRRRSWSETTFFSNLKCALHTILREARVKESAVAHERAEEYSEISKEYFTIVGYSDAYLEDALRPRWFTGPVHPFKLAYWCFTWSLIAFICQRRMRVCSDKVVNLMTYAHMTAGHCDTRQHILRLSREYAEAITCIHAGQKKNPKTAHMILFHLGLADILDRYGDKDSATNELRKARMLIEKREETDARVASEAYHHCAFIDARIRRHPCVIGYYTAKEDSAYLHNEPRARLFVT